MAPNAYERMGDQRATVRPARGRGRAQTLTRVVFLTSSPADHDALKTAAEHRAIRSVLRGSPRRDQFELYVRAAAQPADLFEALCEDNAAILHFSGHGDVNGVAFEDPSGLAAMLPSEALRDAVEAASDVLRMVVLGACHSSATARALVKIVDCAIGVDSTILDTSMRAFAEAFYRGVFAGLTVAKAFLHGRAAATATSTPDGRRLRLYMRTGLHSAELTFSGAKAQAASASLAAVRCPVHRPIDRLAPKMVAAARIAAFFRYVQASHPGAWSAFLQHLPPPSRAEPHVELPACVQ